jgi:methylmalonyl-CoA mutase C-terminal domain/subunit
LPAAGKTGTSHDGWFAGFTSELLCVVWVGYDDYSDLGLEGAKSALPIWTEFMSEAARYKQYGNAKPFKPPQGVTQVSVDPQTGELSGPGCPTGVSTYFVDGTQPQNQCMPQQVEIISTGDGGVIERMTPLQAQPAIPAAPIRNTGHSILLPSEGMDPRIRVLVAKPGLDGHDRGAKVIARALRDAGMEVIYTGLRQTPEMIVSAALQEDVQVIGLSILSGAHNAIVPRIMDLLREKGMDDVLVLVGGIIPDEDAAELKKLGVAAVFQPGASLEAIVDFIRSSVKQTA